MTMLDWYKYKVEYQIDNVIVDFEEFVKLPANQFSDMQVNNMVYEKVLIDVLTQGGEVLDFTFEPATEFEFKLWERERKKDEQLKLSLDKSMNMAHELAHKDTTK